MDSEPARTFPVDLHDLIERLKALKGPDRSVDEDIFDLTGLAPVCDGIHDLTRAPRYTESIDDARKLLPEGVAWGFLHDYGDLNRAHVYDADRLMRFQDDAASPALALCITALRARYGMVPELTGDEE